MDINETWRGFDAICYDQRSVVMFAELCIILLNCERCKTKKLIIVDVTKVVFVVGVLDCNKLCGCLYILEPMK